jgi:DNA-binding NarL/FixJ family response regulator
VAVIEDHPLMRSGVVRAVESAGAVVVSESDTAEGGFAAVVEHRPTTAIVDIGLGEQSGVDLARRLLRRDGRLGVILYTGSGDLVLLKDGLDCGARGFVLKTSGPPVLITALHAVCRGGTYIDDGVPRWIRSLENERVHRVLSGREREVLDLLSRGLSSEEVAARLVLSAETIKTHVRNACRKLGAENRTHAVVLALRNQEIRL